MTTRSTANVLGSAWLWRVLRRALLSVTLAPDILTVPAIAEVPFGFAKKLTKMSAQMPRSKAGVSKEEPKTGSKNDCWEDIAGEMGSRLEREQKNGCENSQCVGKGRFVGGRRRG